MSYWIEVFRVKKSEIWKFQDFLKSIAKKEMKEQYEKQREKMKRVIEDQLHLIFSLEKYFELLYFLQLRLYEENDSTYIISLNSMSYFYHDHFHKRKNKSSWYEHIKDYLRTQNKTDQSTIDKENSWLVKFIEKKFWKSKYFTIEVWNDLTIHTFIFDFFLNMDFLEDKLEDSNLLTLKKTYEKRYKQKQMKKLTILFDLDKDKNPVIKLNRYNQKAIEILPRPNQMKILFKSNLFNPQSEYNLSFEKIYICSTCGDTIYCNSYFQKANSIGKDCPVCEEGKYFLSNLNVEFNFKEWDEDMEVYACDQCDFEVRRDKASFLFKRCPECSNGHIYLKNTLTKNCLKTRRHRLK